MSNVGEFFILCMSVTSGSQEKTSQGKAPTPSRIGRFPKETSSNAGQ